MSTDHTRMEGLWIDRSRVLPLSRSCRANRKYFATLFANYLSDYPPGSAFPGRLSVCPICGLRIVSVDASVTHDGVPSADAASFLPSFDAADRFVYLDIDRSCRPELLDIPVFRAVLEYCRNCRYWRLHYVMTDSAIRGPGMVIQYEELSPKLGQFDDLPEAFSDEVAIYLRRHPHAWHTLTPRQFELLVADIMRLNYDTVDVQHVGGPDDGGIDVVFIERNSQRWLVQAKRRTTPNAAEGVSTIRSLIGAMILDDSKCGIVVSTADHFTTRAVQACNRALNFGLKIDLVDRAVLNRMLTPALPANPWFASVSKRLPTFARHFKTVLPDARQQEFHW